MNGGGGRARCQWSRWESCGCGRLLYSGVDCFLYLLLVYFFDSFLKTELLEHVLGCKELGKGLVGDNVKLINLSDPSVLSEWQPKAATHRLLGENL